MDRRNFIGAAAGAAFAAGDPLRGGIIGAGNRGRYLIGEFKEIGAHMDAVSDVYEGNLDLGLKASNTGARAYPDYRRLLEDKSLEFVIVASPEHWHAQMTIDAVEAGKDVYVEKPMAHTIEEGYRIIEAVRRTKRVVQVGTQRRSFPVFLEAKKMMAEGVAGKVRLVNSWWLNSTPAALAPPQLTGKVDWEKWLGSSPKRPFDAVRFRNWHWFWDYSGGLMVGQAAHVFDAIQWLMDSGPPLTVTASGKQAMKGAEVPETAVVTLEYADYVVAFSLGYKAMRYPFTYDQMKQFHGDKARFDVGRESYALYPEDPKATVMRPTVARHEPGTFTPATRLHIRNFLESIRTRRDPAAPVEAGQLATIPLVLATEALRTGKRMRFNAAARRMEG
jgi:predicted dehydrogenase